MSDITDKLFQRGQSSGRLSEATLRDYASAMRGFRQWCAEHDHQALPADEQVVAEYLVDAAYRVTKASLYRILRAIEHAHEGAGHSSPTETEYVQGVFAGLRDTLPLFDDLDPLPQEFQLNLPAALKKMIETVPDDTLGRRDKALLLVARGARLSRPQIVALDVDDIELSNDAVTVRAKERDQTRTITIKSSPGEFDVASALSDWLADLESGTGSLFRSVDKSGAIREQRLSPQAVTVALQRAAKRADLPRSAASATLFRSP